MIKKSITFKSGTVSRCTCLLILLCAVSCSGNVANHQTFSDPDKALSEFEQIIQDGDKEALRELFGPESDAIYSSGDAIADRNAREVFIRRFNEKHELQTEGQDRYTLLVGNEEWPSPVPLMKNEEGEWYFDGAAGADEIANRRIGQNEIFVMNVCREIADAQKIYYRSNFDGDKRANYARRLLSSHGKKDGLFWPRKPGEEPSPIGPLIASASAEGYRGDGSAGAFHGYRFKLITRRNQRSLLAADGELTRGFVLLAYPAQWGVSGVMSFVITEDGILREKNLGQQSEAHALAMDTFSDSDNWSPVADTY